MVWHIAVDPCGGASADTVAGGNEQLGQTRFSGMASVPADDSHIVLREAT